MSLDHASCLKEIKGIIASRSYYRSARVVLGLVRVDGQSKPVGGFAILSDKPVEATRSLDYDVLVLLETSLSPEAFCEWLTKVVEEGNASVAGFEIDAKGGFELMVCDHSFSKTENPENLPMSSLVLPCSTKPVPTLGAVSAYHT